ncbi:acyltransferase domain-containing protein [Actinomadura yumaensis]|uniref:acyltransferase domain-containing protein n=1 Tax=Actinomadura yumaensis TaxID=111807 RepID=UPI003607D2E3
MRAQASALADHAAGAPLESPAAVGLALATTRTAFEHRAVVVGEGRGELLAATEALARGDAHPGVVVAGAGEAGTGTAAGKTVFLFSGQGSQRPGMGAGLYERFPAFAAAFDEVCALLDEHLDRPVRDVVFADRSGALDHTTYAQAGLFALHVALARLLGAAGVRPDVVIGHSIGEIAAAHVAGVFDLPDACRLVAARATLMGRLPEGGAMATVAATPEELSPDLDAHGGRVAVAALNTPGNTVISGAAGPVAEIAEAWAERGRKTRALTVSHAFHSPLMEPVLAPFEEAVRDLAYRPPAVPLISNLTGEPADERIATPGYWAEHIRRPVRFHPAVAHVAPDAGTFVELGPDSTLTAAARRTLEHVRPDGPAPRTVATLSSRQPDAHAFVRALARLHIAGTDVDWTACFPDGSAPETVRLPTYAFQRERYWLGDAGGGAGDVSAAGARRVRHPFFAAAVELADGGLALNGTISANGAAWTTGHAVAGLPIVPSSALVEWALLAADEAGCGGVEELVVRDPLVPPARGRGPRVQVTVGAAREDGRRDVRVHSRPDHGPRTADDPAWTCHAHGTLAPPAPGPAAPAPEDERARAWPPPEAVPVDLDGLRQRTVAAGYEDGPAFDGIRAVWRDGSDLLAEVALPDEAGGHDGYGLHPVLLEAALRPALLDVPDDARAREDDVWLPSAWNDVALWASEATTVRVRLSPTGDPGRNARRVRVTLTDPAGAPVLTVGSVTLEPVAVEDLRASGGGRTDGLFTLDWTPAPAPTEDASGRYIELDALRTALDADPGAPAPPVVLTRAPTASGGDARRAAEAASTLVRDWLAEPRLSGSRLVVVTRGAVSVDGGERDVPSLADAAVWGVVHSAQAERPDRFVLLDTDSDPEEARLREAVAAALAQHEPQVAIRSAQVLVPRLARAASPGREPPGRTVRSPWTGPC